MEPIQQINRRLETSKHYKYARWCFVGLFVISGLIFAYNRFFGSAPEELESHVAAELPKAKNVKKQTIVGPKQLVVYNRSDLLKKVPVPAEIAADKANQFTSIAEVPKMPYGGQMVTYVNYSTHKTGIAVQANKRPLFGIGGKTQIGLAAGVSTRGNIAGVYAGQDVLRVGPVNLGVAAGVGVVGNDGLGAAVVRIHGEF